jgi:hypothetical protein
MKQKKLVVGLLVMLAVVMSTLTFAYWSAGLTVDDNDLASNTVAIGVGEAVTTSVTLAADSQTSGTLVPVGRADDSSSATPVEAVVIEFTVSLDNNEENDSFAGTEAVLAVAASNIKIDNSTTNASLVGIALSYTATINVDGTQSVTVTVTLTEPTTQAIYSAIAGKDITFDLTFTASLPTV